MSSLALSLTAGEQGRINRDTPADAEAYELYLRANQLELDVSKWSAALDLYRRSVDRDPGFAPAWARLGRCLGGRAGARRRPGRRARDARTAHHI